MIRNPITNKVIGTLKSAPLLDCYLFGSHLFGGAKEWSDKDYFSEYTSDACCYLLDLGFKATGEHDVYGLDEQTVVVYRKGDVDVALVSNLETKIKACQFITSCDAALPRLSKVPKPKRSALWNAVYNLLSV